jgi:hypothetical protein
MVVCGMSYEPFHECSKLDKYFLSRNTVSVNAAPVKKCDERTDNPHTSPLRLRDNSIVHGLGLDQAVLKDEGIHPVGDASPCGVASPLEEE